MEDIRKQLMNVQSEGRLPENKRKFENDQILSCVISSTVISSPMPIIYELVDNQTDL